ncbi:hypothetical protein BJ912DRAFT_1140725 [Pholiota molesta]|nr:hypothetical protein BJ912DRAFT_1140725 [Pholiota molesta]
MEENKLDMRDEEHFPTFLELPDDNDLDLRYYEDPYEAGGVVGPIKHWCLLAEIVEVIPYMRPMFRVKDKANNEFLVACYFDTHLKMPPIWEKRCKKGGVIAILYATSHYFMDGQNGVRVEEMEYVKFLPCSLDALLRIGDDVGKSTAQDVCARCGQPGGLRCSQCSRAKYCGKDCQVADWKAQHKNECVATQQVLEWRQRDWENFDEYWMD